MSVRERTAVDDLRNVAGEVSDRWLLPQLSTSSALFSSEDQ